MTLIWLGWKLLDQGRALAAQRAAERRQVSAEAVVASLDRSLAEAEHWLSGDEPPGGSLRVTAASEPPEGAVPEPRPGIGSGSRLATPREPQMRASRSPCPRSGGFGSPPARVPSPLWIGRASCRER